MLPAGAGAKNKLPEECNQMCFVKAENINWGNLGIQSPPQHCYIPIYWNQPGIDPPPPSDSNLIFIDPSFYNSDNPPAITQIYIYEGGVGPDIVDNTVLIGPTLDKMTLLLTLHPTPSRDHHIRSCCTFRQKW